MNEMSSSNGRVRHNKHTQQMQTAGHGQVEQFTSRSTDNETKPDSFIQ